MAPFQNTAQHSVPTIPDIEVFIEFQAWIDVLFNLSHTKKKQMVNLKAPVPTSYSC